MNGKELVKQTLDQIPLANAHAKRIVGLVKEGGRITGYPVCTLCRDHERDRFIHGVQVGIRLAEELK